MAAAPGQRGRRAEPLGQRPDVYNHWHDPPTPLNYGLISVPKDHPEPMFYRASHFVKDMPAGGARPLPPHLGPAPRPAAPAGGGGFDDPAWAFVLMTSILAYDTFGWV